MEKTEKDKLQKDVYKILNRTKKYGRESEAVKIKMELVLKGTPAINYKVLKLFSPQISDSDLVNMLFRLGVQNGAELLKIVAPRHGIQI